MLTYLPTYLPTYLHTVDDDSWTDFLVFSAAFFANMGNFKSFGDIRIIPSLSADKLYQIIQVCM